MEKLPMDVVNPLCAGIDVGSRFHMVAVDQDIAHVGKFGVYTHDHQNMVAWLGERGITSVAMESTGSYWQTLFDALQRAGFEVLLINGGQVKNVRGKKTDVQDCVWIQKLHSLGLLRGSFLPNHELQSLRTYYGHRQYLIGQCTRYVNKMQKALRLMNIRLDVVLNDIMGQSGRKIIEAILAGERDALALAGLANYRVRKSKGEIARSLEGNCREDLLFELGSCLKLYDTHVLMLSECDRALEGKLASVKGADAERTGANAPGKGNEKKPSKHSPAFDVRNLAERYFGVDLMGIPGVSHNTVLCLLTQVGNDIHKFPTCKHFCSWLRLAPNNKISGGKVLSSRTPKGKNRLALALRQAANSIGNQKEGELVRFFKRVAFRKDRASAITATARKLATIMYQMITKGECYMPNGQPDISDKAKNKMIKNIKDKIKLLNLSGDQLKFIFDSNSLSTS